MKELQDIIYKVPILEVRGNLAIEVRDFFSDSREVVSGSLFVAIRGTQVNGHDFIADAIANGADAVICETFPPVLQQNVVYLLVRDSALSWAHIAANCYDNPADSLKIVGVTGTNGKTTVATLLYKLFNALGFSSGLVSTVAVAIGKRKLPATHTTPDAKELQGFFRNMVNEGCTHCFMEVSSHALVQQRTASIPFVGALFTNITHDHLDYHGSFSEYIKAKKILFDQLPETAFALINLDDRNAEVMLQNTLASRKTCSTKKPADFRGKIIENSMDGLLMETGGQQVWFRLVGEFNASNLLMVFAAAVLCGIDPASALLELSRMEGVAGRFQMVKAPDRSITAIVDYAHTPDALKNVLVTIRKVSGESGKLITVVGCGGNRDKTKRPEMGKIAAELSDQVILTSDNPRNEDPGEIINEMIAGVPVSLRRRVVIVTDRREAIAVACRLAGKSDIVLVAGKGHETYQEIRGIRQPFDDREILLETFKTLNT